MLTLCIITKNEEKNLPKLFESIVPYVDKVVITDTGSTDKTKEISEKYCGEKLKWTTFEWCDDFSAARNYNFSQADKNSWVIWADADDTILNAKELKSIIKDCEKNGITQKDSLISLCSRKLRISTAPRISCLRRLSTSSPSITPERR
jgi:glycosyltransferase involved in cell wall biosynthesis